PGIALAFNLTRDFTTGLKGAYTPSYEGAMAAVFERGLPGIGSYLTYDVSVPGRRTLIDSKPPIVYKIDSDIKHPRVDEVYGAIERALGATTRLTVTGIYRENKNFINSVNPSPSWTPVTVRNCLTH